MGSGVYFVVLLMVLTALEAVEISRKKSIDPGSILDIVNKNWSYEVFLFMVFRADIVDEISPPPKKEDPGMVVFVPTNTAFSHNLPAQAAMLNDSVTLVQALHYHILVSSPLNLSKIDQLITTKAGSSLRANNYSLLGEHLTTVNCVPLPQPITATNGQVYEVGAVLIEQKNTIKEVLASQYLLLNKIIDIAQIPLNATADSPITLFAPTDGAILNLSTDVFASLIGDPQKARLFLNGHLVEGSNVVCSSCVARIKQFKTRVGKDIHVSVHGGSVRLNKNVEVTQVDALAKDGVVHQINGLLYDAA